MFWRQRDGAQVSEKLAALEIRLASLEAEVRAAVGKVEVWGAREVARNAAFEEATDKLYRTAERARKLRRGGGGDGDAGDSDQPGDADAAFDRVYREYVGRPVALP